MYRRRGRDGSLHLALLDRRRSPEEIEAQALEALRQELQTRLHAHDVDHAARVMRHLVFVHDELGRSGWLGVADMPSNVLGKALVQVEMLHGQDKSRRLAKMTQRLRLLKTAAEVREESRPRREVDRVIGEVEVEVAETTHMDFEETERDDGRWAALRQHPRFVALLQRMKLDRNGPGKSASWPLPGAADHGKATDLKTAHLAVPCLIGLLAACSTPAPPAPWESRLQGEAIVLLGEVHDNAVQHRLRLEVLRRAFAAGWRPAIAMEQFDRERQGDIERARAERPGDAQHVIERASTPAVRTGGGWNWDFYRPYVALALQYDVPLVAANLSNADATKIVRSGLGQVFDAAGLATLGLDQPIAADWQAAQEREIDRGHCRALPREVWPRMARAQFARDAVMAEVLRRHGRGRGMVLLAGNGHVRRDIGVPRWLGGEAARLFAVGFLERGDGEAPSAAFDAVVVTEAASRSDPCAVFKPAR